jgi:hypothetical protein
MNESPSSTCRRRACAPFHPRTRNHPIAYHLIDTWWDWRSGVALLGGPALPVDAAGDVAKQLAEKEAIVSEERWRALQGVYQSFSHALNGAVVGCAAYRMTPSWW